MDFIASIPTMYPSWTAPYDIIDNIFKPLLGDLDDKCKCQNLFLLFDNIAKSEGIRAGAIAFKIQVKIDNSPAYVSKSFYKCEKGNISYNFFASEDFPVAIYLGTSGLQAFYSIVENIIRNATRHSKLDRIKRVKEASEKLIRKEKVDPKDILEISIEFHYDTKENNYKDEYILVRIYDNMGGWVQKTEDIWVLKEKNGKVKQAVLLKEENEIEKELNDKILNRKFNPNFPEGRIIDDTGNIIEGYWGLKEMRICASFLRGLRVSDYDKSLKDEPPVIRPFISAINRSEGSLGFEFYLPKTKHLLVVSDDMIANNKKEELKNKGIYFVDDIYELERLKNKGTFTHEFILIDIDNDIAIRFINEHILKLPYKLLYLSENDDNINEIIMVDPKAKNKLIKKDEFKNYISKPAISIGEENIKLSVDQKILVEIYKKWIGNLNSDYQEMKIGLQPGDSIDGLWEKFNLIGFCKCNFHRVKNKIKVNKLKILFDHGFEFYKSLNDSQCPLCVFPFTRGISNKITEMWRMLTEARKKIGYKELLGIYRTLECALVNILIIDERIFDSLNSKKKIANQDVYLAYYWYLQNVVSIELTKGGEEPNFYAYKIEHPITLDKPPNKERVELKNIHNYLPPQFKNNLHFLIIHRSIIQSSKMGYLDGFNKFLNSLPKQFKPWNVIITSGIGHPPESEMPPGSRFIHFSELVKIINKELDKYLFLRTITSIKE